MKIVEYNNSLAAKVADMWNKSGSNWGDELELRNEADVINEESNSANLHLFLAMEDDEVIGYCSFSEYQHDVGASYLPSLNVRPDFHGKGIGKALILRTLEEAVKSKWPRFDLFTWSGNLKAMPLYKKCGFFWEKKTDTVHLMNFIPYLYQTPALDSYLKDIDWYKDSKRVIDMNFDGVNVQGFDYFRYDFENDLTKLAFEFEKTSRGLRFIDTPDYSIEWSLAKAKPIQNEALSVDFKIVNKTNQPLNIKLLGKSNQFVVNDIDETIDVLDEVTLTKSVKVLEMYKTVDKMRTYPYVEVDVFINGLLANFRLGIEPKSPLDVSINIPTYNHFAGKRYIGYLEVENNLDQTTIFEVSLPKTLIASKSLTFELKSLEKRSIELEYEVLNTGFLDVLAHITYLDKAFKRPVKAVIKGIDKPFTAENEERAFAIHGNYMAVYSKLHQEIYYLNSYDNNDILYQLSVPQIGMPYSLEFSNIEPTITFPNAYSMDITFASKDFLDVLAIIHLVNLNGVLKVNYELKNLGEKRTLGLGFEFWVNLNDVYIPYHKKILKIDDSSYVFVGHIDSEAIDENWIYSHKHKSGITWDKSEQVRRAEWQLKSSKDNIVLNTNQSYVTKDYFISYSHTNLKAFRAFAGNTVQKDYRRFLEVDINQGNPFTDNLVHVSIDNLKKVIFKGNLEVDGLIVPLNQSVTTKPGLNKIKVDSAEETFEVDRLTFKMKGEVLTKKESEVLTVDNGVLSFKASQSYSDAITSLIFNNHEWLDSNYPEPKSRAWWGKYSGGINFRKQRMQDLVVLEEKRTVEFTELTDHYKNKWVGIKSTVYFEKDEIFKGLIFESYTLTLPGVPVVQVFNNVINKSGKRINSQLFVRFNCLQCDDDPTKVLCDIDGKLQKCHQTGLEKGTKKLLSLQSTRENKLYIYDAKNQLELDSQKEYTNVYSIKRLDIPDNSNQMMAPCFYIFSKEKLTKETLKDLNNIKFDL